MWPTNKPPSYLATICLLCKEGEWELVAGLSVVFVRLEVSSAAGIYLDIEIRMGVITGVF